nr:hypothetical protein [Tanacetum cinerariifolium]
MVNTRTDADLSAAVQNALQTLLPQIFEEIREEFRTGSGSSNAGGNPPLVNKTGLALDVEVRVRMNSQRELDMKKKVMLANEDLDQDQPTYAEPVDSNFGSSKLETEDVSVASAKISDEIDEDKKTQASLKMIRERPLAWSRSRGAQDVEVRVRMNSQRELDMKKKVMLANEDLDQDQPTYAEPVDSNFGSNKLETEDVSVASAEISDEIDEDKKNTSQPYGNDPWHGVDHKVLK